LVGLAALALGTGCAGQLDENAKGGGDPSPGGGGGGIGTGTQDASGGGPGDALADGAASADGGVPVSDARGAGDAAPEPACVVTITPLSPPQLLGLANGPTKRLRVRGELHGSALPANPVWTWSVTYQSTTIASTPDPMNPAIIQFPLLHEGTYFIRAQVLPTCSAEVVATAVPASTRSSTFRIRLVPPRPSMVPPQEVTIGLSAGSNAQRDLDLRGFPLVYIDPQTVDGSATVPSYIRVTSSAPLFQAEGSNDRDRLPLQLDPALSPYSILVVPAGDFAPAVYTANSPASIVTDLKFALDRGAPVSGVVKSSDGPVQNARVLLRAGALPSSIGRADSTGRFGLRARAGVFTVSILPPIGTPLPNVRVADAITLAEPLPASLTADFQWAALDVTRLELTVRDAGGGIPGKPVVVRLTSHPDDLRNVGTLTVGPRQLPGAGSVERQASTDSAGLVSFANLPKARYRATLVPPADLPDAAATNVNFDISTGAATTRTSLDLARKVKITGRLFPATLAASSTVMAFDAAPDRAGSCVPGTVGEDGRFTLTCDPGRTYRLYAEPDATRALPRAPLGAVTAAGVDASMEDRTLPSGASLAGVVRMSGIPVERVVIQVYCVGELPDCLEYNGNRAQTIRPIAEATSGPGGTYRLVLPDPATGD
jgi:hypothetical protein